MFYYCSYWGRWSRVLSTENFNYVEVNLTPIPGSTETWADVAEIRIRKHCTARGKNDLIMSELPADVVSTMKKNLGICLTDRLLNEDFLSQIDWDLYRKHDNGGAILSKINNVDKKSAESTGRFIHVDFGFIDIDSRIKKS